MIQQSHKVIYKVTNIPQRSQSYLQSKNLTHKVINLFTKSQTCLRSHKLPTKSQTHQQSPQLIHSHQQIYKVTNQALKLSHKLTNLPTKSRSLTASRLFALIPCMPSSATNQHQQLIYLSLSTQLCNKPTPTAHLFVFVNPALQQTNTHSSSICLC